MSTAARIDELRKKFEENPRRYFAPLANEYRKAGDLSQAIALCREFLPKQPGHMSGFIVFGQALFEAGELDEARSVFEQALALDPENLIALRHLGDIARAGGDGSGARRWYERVLDADPRNDDIAAQLATLGSPRTPATAVPTQAPTFESVAARMSETPAIPMDPIGYTVVPTPDSVMRAVDVDNVGARARGRTPIDLDAIEDLGGTTDAPSEDAHEPVQEPVAEVTSSDVASSDVASSDVASSEITLYEETLFEAVLAVDVPAVDVPAEESDPFDFDAPAEAPAEASAEASADAPVDAESNAESTPEVGTFAELAIIEDEESFEEGLIAANWPDTTELEARVMTPRSVTPRSVTPVSVTPLSSAALDDAASAFGREPDQPVAAYDDHTDVLEPVLEADLGADDAEPLVMIEAESQELTPPVSFDAVTDEVEIASFDHVHADIASTPTELPWLAVSESPTDMVQELDASEPGLEEIAEVFADDARAAGDEGAVTVAALEDPVPSGESESFADVAQAIDDEAAEAAEALEAEVDREVAHSLSESVVTPAADSPAFVTETMGELLVAQGFVARAIDVYDELVRRRPYDPVLSARLDELRAMMVPPASAEPAFEEAQAEHESSFDSALFDDFASPVLGDADLPTPPYGTPVSTTPVTGVSALTGMPYRTPVHSTPVHSTPVYTQQVTPAVTPYAQPAVAEEFAPRRSAREWFAALAARRVPRRTPTQSAPAVDNTPEGLASLFGETSAVHDDAAARALADAFAPLSEQDLESTPSLDFTFSHSTPAFSPAVATPAAASVITPPPAATPTGGNAGFSFDKFFPDAATRRGTPAAPSPAVTDAPVTDDLAQFSAWLKGLGNT